MKTNSYDLIIKGGMIIDGSGEVGYLGNIGINGDRIVKVGKTDGAESRQTINADGLAVCPGFFDVHTHSDFSLILNPFPINQLMQGVTSEIEGNCGYSAFPLVDTSRGFLFEPKTISSQWSSASEYFDALINSQSGINAATFVGHTIIRAAVCGRDQRKVTPAELTRMKAHVRSAMQAGALGLSSGLVYPPGGAADVDELAELCRVVAEFGGMYSSHVRGQTDNFVNAVEEAIEVGRRAKVPVQISHFGAAGKNSLWLTRRALDLVDRAREEGIDVMIDVIPYRTSAGAWWAPRAILPEWAYDWRVNNLGHVRNLLLSPETRERLRHDVEARRVLDKSDIENEMMIFNGWEEIFLTEVKPGSSNTSFVDMNIEETSRVIGKSPVDTYFDLLIDEYPEFSSARLLVDPQALCEMLQKPYAMIGSDSVATSPERAHESFNAIQAHPRNYGTFPQVLGTLTRNEGILTWEDAIRKMTGLPAQRFGFKGRGLIQEGMYADLVIFDKMEIRPRSTWRQPQLLPEGIYHVLVNGQPAVSNGRPTGLRFGQVVRHLSKLI